MTQRFGIRELINIVSGSGIVIGQLPPVTSSNALLQAIQSTPPATLAGTIFIAWGVGQSLYAGFAALHGFAKRLKLKA